MVLFVEMIRQLGIGDAKMDEGLGDLSPTRTSAAVFHTRADGQSEVGEVGSLLVYLHIKYSSNIPNGDGRGKKSQMLSHDRSDVYYDQDK